MPIIVRNTSSNRRRHWVVATVLLVVATAIWAYVMFSGSHGRIVATRPYIRNLSIAPKSAQSLIRSIATRTDASCYPAILGKNVTPTLTVTKYNFQDFDYVEVVNVVDNQKVIELNVDCVFGAADNLVSTPEGWKDLGQRQM